MRYKDTGGKEADKLLAYRALRLKDKIAIDKEARTIEATMAIVLKMYLYSKPKVLVKRAEHKEID